ncbi:hypothetical protein LMG23992_02013 [Cupriavidus laharis]|uniref:Uncharacterized protein n=1 Tax=Cupriavidus laharis TaxID=151654 RepID=A0ABM8WW11_9BURK|nr:hypothetical protein LMG23992_02013 [Cupriavidus laharis]
MDGVFLIVLILFAAASAALLRLCAALGTDGTGSAAPHGGLQHHAVPGKHSAADRGL